MLISGPWCGESDAAEHLKSYYLRLRTWKLPSSVVPKCRFFFRPVLPSGAVFTSPLRNREKRNSSQWIFYLMLAIFNVKAILVAIRRGKHLLYKMMVIVSGRGIFNTHTWQQKSSVSFITLIFKSKTRLWCVEIWIQLSNLIDERWQAHLFLTWQLSSSDIACLVFLVFWELVLLFISYELETEDEVVHPCYWLISKPEEIQKLECSYMSKSVATR